jgi:hypothetical protein
MVTAAWIFLGCATAFLGVVALALAAFPGSWR